MGRKKKNTKVLFVNDRTLYYNTEDEDIGFVKPQYGEDFITIKRGTVFYCPSIKDEGLFDFSTINDCAICLIPKSKRFALNFSSLVMAKGFGIVRKESKRKWVRKK